MSMYVSLVLYRSSICRLFVIHIGNNMTTQIKPHIQKNTTPTFSQYQIDYLTRMFPNTAHSPEVSEAMLRYANGQRSVLDHIKSLVGERHEAI